MKQIRFFLFSCLLCITKGVYAYDFSAMNADGVMIYYNITSSTDLTCEVTSNYPTYYFGTINIPAHVTYNYKSYSVTSIGDYAFQGCSGLTNVTIPNSVISIGTWAFSGCINLQNPIYNNTIYVKMPTSYTGSFTIPEGITTIAEYAFEKCSKLTDIEIPSTVTSIGSYAFVGCTGLKSITVNWWRPLSIRENVFDDGKDQYEKVDYDNCVLYVPKGTCMMYMVAPVWINFKNIEEFTPTDEEVYTIAICSTQGTIIQQVVDLNKSYSFMLDNKKKGNIVSVTFNGKDVLSEVKDGIYTTPKITGNSEIMVTYDNQPKGDTNNDGVVDVTDITATASIILNNAKHEQKVDE